MNWELAGQIATLAVIWMVVGLVAAPSIGHWLRKRRHSAECARLEKLCELADEFEAAPTDAERKRVFIKASALGFLDDREAFHLDEPDQPHPPTGRAA